MKERLLKLSILFTIYYAINYFISFEVAVLFALADIGTKLNVGVKQLKQ